jgi:ABC-type transport system substrate-binding protein
VPDLLPEPGGTSSRSTSTRKSADDLPNYTAEDKIGGGPFWARSEGLHWLVRNPNWFGPAGDGRGDFRFYADANAEFQALKSGEIDASMQAPEQSGEPQGQQSDHGIAGNQGCSANCR